MLTQRSGDSRPHFSGERITQHDSLRVDDVVIDGDNTDVIRITHNRADGIDLIDATDRRTGTKNFRVDSHGNVVSNGVSVTTEVGAATHLDDGASGTAFCGWSTSRG